MGNHAIKAAATATIALVLAACDVPESPNTLEDTMEEGASVAIAEGGVGTVEEAFDAADLPPVPLPYHGKFQHVYRHVATRRFIVPHLASLQVLVTTAWNDPSCGGHRSLNVSLHEENHQQVGGERIYRTDGKVQGASWQNLEPGTYYVDLEVRPAYPRCELAGDVSITL